MSDQRKSIVKDSTKIHSFLLQRIEELKLKPAAIIKDAAGLGMKIENASLSKYMKNGNCKGGLSEETIVWLCIRYGIDLKLIVGSIKLEGKMEAILPAYDEAKAITKLKTLF